jgi:hypothetical protein
MWHKISSLGNETKHRPLANSSLGTELEKPSPTQYVEKTYTSINDQKDRWLVFSLIGLGSPPHPPTPTHRNQIEGGWFGQLEDVFE